MHHGIVQADREEHLVTKLILFFAGSHRLALDPSALNGMFRKDEDELVVETNGFIDSLMVVVANLEIFRRKPATYPLCFGDLRSAA